MYCTLIVVALLCHLCHCAVDRNSMNFEMYESIHKFALILQPAEYTCLYQYFETGSQVYSQIKVEEVGKDVGMKVILPNGVDFSDFRWGPEFVDEFTVEMTGDYGFCLSNVQSGYSATQVGVALVGFDKRKINEYLANISDLSTIHTAIIESLSNVAEKILRMQFFVAHSESHKSTDMRILGGIDNYVYKCSLTLSILMILSAAVQVFLIKNLFSNQNQTKV